ncbi:MAG: G1 family endopeptidase [Thaumarchaeota archaeon]|nr:G1 family endopeptidase [Nitrososphaerota archaeon]
MRFATRSTFTTVLLSSVVILLFCFSSFSTPVNSTTTTPVSAGAKLSKVLSVSSWGSLNWAGYAINASANSVTQVKGSWIQPAVICPASGLQAASFWVGIDGLTSLTVEQTGTLALCIGGVASYSAWYEFYPAYSVNITTMAIHPGDKISALVKYSTITSKFTTTIKDLTTGKSFSHTAAVPGAARSSAEWIAEAPSSPSCPYTLNICPLPNFGSVSFGKDTTLVTGTNTATISGVTKPLGMFGSEVDSMTMIDLSSTFVKALPSAKPSTDGTSFSVTWFASGP